MKNLKFNVFILSLSLFGCNANTAELNTILECKNTDGSSLSVKYNSSKIIVKNKNYDFSENISDVTYNKNYRYKIEITVINLSNGYNVFKNFDAEFNDNAEFGVTDNEGKSTYCNNITSENFIDISKIFKCDKNNALGCDNQLHHENL
jgi:hypothetical protein